MAYGGEPDWQSLKAICLTDSQGRYLEGLSVDEVIQGLRRWQEDEVVESMAPGMRYRDIYVTPSILVSALKWSASAVAAGVVGDAAYDLVCRVVGS